MCEQKLLTRGLDILGIRLDMNSRDALLLYCRELRKWNKRINLIARNTSADEVIEKHFLDSLTLLPLIDKYGGKSATLLDVGTGAGFPGLVLATALPELQVTLVEPRQKRVSFLRHIMRTLQLTNVDVIADRLEQANLKEQNFTFITSRAVADITRFITMLADIPAPDSMVIVMQATTDLEQWLPGGQGRDWQLVENRKFHLPFSDASRLLAVIRKR